MLNITFRSFSYQVLKKKTVEYFHFSTTTFDIIIPISENKSRMSFRNENLFTVYFHPYLPFPREIFIKKIVYLRDSSGAMVYFFILL